MFPLPPNILFEIAALIISLLCYHSIKDKPLRWFIPFLLLMVAVELTGRHLQLDLKKMNVWLYNISIPIEYFFYTFIFYSYYKNTFFKKVSGVLLVLMLPAALFNIVAIQGFYNLNTNILIAGSCMMILFSCAYFIDIFLRDEAFVLLREPMFWISTGVFFFNLGELTYNLAFDYILAHDKDDKWILFSAINSKLVYVLYTCISIAILCTQKPIRKI